MALDLPTVPPGNPGGALRRAGARPPPCIFGSKAAARAPQPRLRM